MHKSHHFVYNSHNGVLTRPEMNRSPPGAHRDTRPAGRPPPAKQRRTDHIHSNGAHGSSYNSNEHTLHIQFHTYKAPENPERNGHSARSDAFGRIRPRVQGIDSRSAEHKGAREVIMRRLKKVTENWFPGLNKRVYLKPAVHFNRVLYEQKDVGAFSQIKVLVPAKQMSDVRENEAKQRIHSALTRLFHKLSEPVFVVFEVDFDNYLNDPQNVPAAEAKVEAELHHSNCEKRQAFSPDEGPWRGAGHGLPKLAAFPRPRDYKPKGGIYNRGRYDVLIIHPKHGFMIFDVRAIGDVFQMSDNLNSVANQTDAILKKVRKSLDQLDKEEEMMQHLCSDILPPGSKVPVVKGLMLPNLDKQSFRVALTQDSDLQQHFCRCMKENDIERAFEQCIFRDTLPPIGCSLELSEDNVNELLSVWWKRLVQKAKTVPSCMDGIYEAMIARFCGPATSQYVNTSHNAKADVSTLDKAVLETALCFSDPVLTQEKVSLLTDELGPRVYITGPPATAKSVLLQFKCEQWLRQWETVFILSLWEGSHVASLVLYNKIRKADPLNLHHLLSKEHYFNDVLTELDNWVSEKRKSQQDGQRIKLFLVIDEAPWFLGYFLNKLQKRLQDQAVDLVIWAASTMSTWKPDRFHEVVLDRSLRCPPVVIREMMKGCAYSAFNSSRYSRLDAGGLAGMPSPTDGPPVKRIQHRCHGTGEVWDCSPCGKELAAFLTKELRIGAAASGLTFSDVLISGYMPSPAGVDESCDFLDGLRRGKVPIDIISRSADVISKSANGWKGSDGLADMDRVQIAKPESILGLERPVVVVIGTTDVRRMYPRYVDPWFDVMSRCTSQLVVVGEMEPSLELMLDDVGITLI